MIELFGKIDKNDYEFVKERYGEPRLEKFSYKDSGFEYFNGADWVAIPTSGVENIYAGNLARYNASLANGLKYWRVRAFAG